MPLYEYSCRNCGHQFEALVRDANLPPCPSCRGQDVERKLSLFAVSSAATRKANLEAGRRHNAKEARDKAVAEQEMMHHHHH